MNEQLIEKWATLSKGLMDLSVLIYGKPIDSGEGCDEEVIRLSYEPESNQWLCICEVAIGLDCYETGETPEEVMQKALAVLEEKLKKEIENVQEGKYRLYGLEEE